MTHTGSLGITADLKISSLQTNALIVLGTHKGLALQGLNSVRRVEDSSAKPKLIAPGLLNPVEMTPWSSHPHPSKCHRGCQGIRAGRAVRAGVGPAAVAG